MTEGGAIARYAVILHTLYHHQKQKKKKEKEKKRDKLKSMAEEQCNIKKRQGKSEHYDCTCYCGVAKTEVSS